MTFQKGASGNPDGRPPGSTNRATNKAREAIAKFVDDNADKLQQWLEKIAEKDPKQAYDCFMSVVEYHIPKLARTEQQFLDKDGEPADASITVKYVE